MYRIILLLWSCVLVYGCGGSDNNSTNESVNENLAQSNKVELTTLYSVDNIGIAANTETSVVVHNQQGEAIARHTPNYDGYYSFEWPDNAAHITVVGQSKYIINNRLMSSPEIKTFLNVSAQNLGKFYFSDRSYGEEGCREINLNISSLKSDAASYLLEIDNHRINLAETELTEIEIFECNDDDLVPLILTTIDGASSKAAVISAIGKNQLTPDIDDFIYDGIKVMHSGEDRIVFESLTSPFVSLATAHEVYSIFDNSYHDVEVSHFVYPSAPYYHVVDINQYDGDFFQSNRLRIKTGTELDDYVTPIIQTFDINNLKTQIEMGSLPYNYDFSHIYDKSSLVAYSVHDSRKETNWTVEGPATGEIPNIQLGDGEYSLSDFQSSNHHFFILTLATKMTLKQYRLLMVQQQSESQWLNDSALDELTVNGVTIRARN
ncbi:hypothetical protein [Shewanella marina]|uniref:hypothetical protein n=1 Tax=Shewanella marina TaxID=487319 RepID=UPI00046FD367|nr:hypothetical protein [Shewanella marina]